MSMGLICTSTSLWYLHAEAPTPTPSALQATGQLAYSMGEGGVQGYQILVPPQPGIRV